MNLTLTDVKGLLYFDGINIKNLGWGIYFNSSNQLDLRIFYVSDFIHVTMFAFGCANRSIKLPTFYGSCNFLKMLFFMCNGLYRYMLHDIAL